jgi:selenide,water dikinase
MFPPERFPQLLAGLEPGDDAAVYKVDENLAIVATIDFITPIVDDPCQFGAIAAANSLSDVYAMGGRPVFALNVCCLPECLPRDTAIEILRGGAEKVSEAGAALVGGHTVDDDEPKYGLAVVGFVHPDRFLTKAGAEPGDALVLTKPVGAGMVTTALKADQADPEHVRAAVESMLKLNSVASELFIEHHARSCTDVTGFALIGHSCEMADASGVLLRLSAGRIPFLPGAEEYADLWLFPEGTARNRNGFSGRARFDKVIPEEIQQLLCTPETAGGLLAAVPPDQVHALQDAAAGVGEPLWLVGEVLKGQGVEVVP